MTQNSSNPTEPVSPAAAWRALRETADRPPRPSLNQLVRDRDRVGQLLIAAGELQVDFSRTHLDHRLLQALDTFTQALNLSDWRRALEQGAIVNPTEKQAALHHYCRLSDEELSALRRKDSAAEAILTDRQKCFALAEKIRDGRLTSSAGQPYTDVLHLGIGGSALGPELVVESLGYGLDRSINCHFVANIDGHTLEPVLRACHPQQTLVIVCSKTFTTLETLCNARQVKKWLIEGGVTEPMKQFVAITARAARAAEFGLEAAQILSFPSTIGGRYSVWSAVALPAMIVLGTEVYRQFLRGAREMDRHFFSQPLVSNAPMLAGALDVWYRNCRKNESLGLFCYDQRLSLLIPYCQQLYMESNGKDRDRQGRRLAEASAPVLWGGVGTEAQHAVFQLLHQGTGHHLLEFIAARRAGHDIADHHRHLLANLLAQSSALAQGREQIDGKQEQELDFINASRLFSGDRPSTIVVMPQLNASALGALLVYYEHRTFTSGVLWGINVFDQMGVELGKEMAGSMYELLDPEASLERDKQDQLDPSLQQILQLLR